MRSWRVAALAFLLGSAGTALGASRLFLSDLSGHGTLGSFGDVDGSFTATLGNGGLDVFFDSHVTFFQARFTFKAPGGGPPAPGRYEGVRDSSFHPVYGGPLIYRVVTEEWGCYDFTGFFVVHELVVGAGDVVTAFSADATLQCQDASTRIVAVRFRTGDAGCASVPDGTPCDDGNACTATDGCAAGVCVGTDAVSAGCPSSDQCHRPPVCDPIAGACTAPPVPPNVVCDDDDPGTVADLCLDGLCAGCGPRGSCEEFLARGFQGECFYQRRPDGAPCDDGDPCTTGETCADGTCIGTPTPCDDRDPCTVDACDAASGGCTSVARADCWTVLGPTVVRYGASGVVYGRHVTCGYRCRTTQTEAIVFESADRFRIPGGRVSDCPTGADVAFPDLVGRVRAVGRRGSVLVPDDLGPLRAAVRECTGPAARLLGTRVAFRSTTDPIRLEGKWTLRVRVRDLLPVSVTTVTHFFATLRTATEPVAPAVSPRAGRLPICAPPARIRCAVD
ncbi:MAG TPA: hypothetical protein VKA21_07750 [Candidatus Binatia bacterium]|nr:hypothetical protein [Candidatus Binatia bacterium]